MSAQQSLKEELSGLYYDQSKHSVYQTLPRFVEEAFSFNFAIDQQWRGDQVRMDYLEQLLEWTGKSVIDIGANTGYFALNLAHDHDCRVTCIEANPSHCLLIERIAEHFQMQGVHVVNQAVGVGQAASLPKADVALLFNVLHHAGHDFDQEHVRNPAEVEEYCVQYLGALRQHVNNLVFQMGYNWGGDKSRPIVAVADTRGFFAYQSRILARAGWRIDCKRSPTAKVLVSNRPHFCGTTPHPGVPSGRTFPTDTGLNSGLPTGREPPCNAPRSAAVQPAIP